MRFDIQAFLVALIFSMALACDSKNDQHDNSRGGKMHEDAISNDSVNAETTVDGEEKKTDTTATKHEAPEYERPDDQKSN